MAATKSKPKPGAKSKGLMGAKVGGIPIVVIAGGVVLAIALGLYLRNKSGAGGTATASSPTTPDAVGSSGGASGSGATDPAGGIDLTPLSDLAYSLQNLPYILGASNGFTLNDGSSAPAAASSATLAPWASSSNPGTIFQSETGSLYALGPSGVFMPAYTGSSGDIVSPGTYAGLGVTPDPISSPPPVTYVQPQNIPQPPAQQATKVQPFGGVTGTKTLASGATVTTYASGRQVEQAPGKSPYVIKK